MQVTNISEAKAQLSALIEKVLAGEEIIIGKAGKPVARLVRYEKGQGDRQPVALKGKIKIAVNFDILPDDRMLIAQAATEGLTIATHDPIFEKYSVPLLR